MRLIRTLLFLYMTFSVLCAFSNPDVSVANVNGRHAGTPSNNGEDKHASKRLLTTQTITFATLASKSPGAADYSPGATASSGLTVAYASSNTAVATIVSGQIHIVGAGTAVITASQAGDATYSAASSVQQPLLVRTIQSGDYVSSGSMNWSGGTWNISDGDGGYSSTTTTAPSATQNVYILSGHTVTLNAAPCSVKNLTVESGATLTAAASTNTLVVAGDMVMDGSFLRPAFDITTTVTGDVTIGGIWALGNLTTGKNVYILSSGVAKGSTTAGGTVQSVKFGGTSPTIQIDGQFGGTGAGITGESIRMFPTGTGTTTFTGAGKVFLARFQPEAAATTTQTIVVDIDMNFGNSVNSAVTFTLQNNVNATSNPKTLTINAGRTLKLSNANGGFHSIATATESTLSTTNLGNMTYNINGTLDVSAGHFALYSNNNASSSAQQITVNVGSGGLLKLGANVRMAKAFSTQKIFVNVADGGTIDASTAALNLTTAPVSANAHTTNGSGYSWFTLSPNAVYKRLTAANTAAPLWIGTTNSNYTPVTVTPSTATVISAGLITTRSSAIQDESRAVKTSWKITPAAASSTTLTFGYNAADINASANAAANMVLFQQNAAGNGWTAIASATPAAGIGSDKQVTFSGMTTSFTIVNYGLENLSPQSITFATLPSKTTADADFDAGATASSGLAVSYTSSNSAVATIVSGKVHIVGVGTTTITGSQAGNISWLAASDATQNLTVIQGQSITFPSLSPKTLADTDFSAGATASSGLVVSYTSSNTAVATINSGKIHIAGLGTSTITASQPGDASHPAAADVTQLLTVKNAQAITFAALPNKTIGDADFDAGATTSSGMTVSYTSSDTTVAKIVSGSIHLVGAGTSTITASQAGDATYYAATSVAQTLTINKRSQTITFTTLPSKTFGDADFDAGATASSGLAISYTSSNTSVATLVSGKIHITGAGTTNITAAQPGDATWAAADAVTSSLTVSAYSLPTDMTPFSHPGISHKRSDLERMKGMVAAGTEPWKSSFASLKASPYSSRSYVVRGNPSNTTFNADLSSEYDKFKFDGIAAYNNSLMWYITGDSHYADKAVEIFKAWSNINHMTLSGTEALSAGRILWKMVEAAEIIKSTYPGWSQTDINKFKAMLVYPGYSTTVFPTTAKNNDDVTFYWNMYNGDPGRHGNQGLFAMRSMIAMAIFSDNRTMYDRVVRLLKGLPHRADDLPYPAGPSTSTGAPIASASNQYYDEYNNVTDSTTIDYGYNELIQNYIWPNGQSEEASRDQSHGILGVGILSAISEIAWNQRDDLYGFLNNRVLKGVEYTLKYNISYQHAFPDQPSPWEPSGSDFIQQFDRSGRWFSKQINPFNGNNLTGITRGASTFSNLSPIYELNLAHYQDRLGLTVPDVTWLKRGLDISNQAYGYEQGGFEADHLGWGGLTYHRAPLCPGDPVTFANGTISYKMNTLPGIVEAENFDYFNGNGQGKTYNDLSSANTGGQYRPAEGVDIATRTGGGYYVLDMEPGEWINYTVSVPATGLYKIGINYAALNGNAKLRVEFNGQDKTGDVAIPFGGTNSTGGQDWKDLTLAPQVTLQAGVQSMRIFVSGTEKGLNLNSISINLFVPGAVPAAPNLTAKAGNSQVPLSWSASTGANSYTLKRADTTGGGYTVIAAGLTTLQYTDSGLSNGKPYYYVISATDSIGESANSTEVSATPQDTYNLIEDHFSTGTGGPVTGRLPEDATIGSRVYEVANTVTPNSNVVLNGNAVLTYNIGEAINITSGSGYTKPRYIHISSDFDLGTMTNNTPTVVPPRAVYLGFWSALPTVGESWGNMRGVFLNPEDGELQLWNGSASQSGIPVQTLPYKGTWTPGDAPHSISYTVDITTGNISEFKLDSVSYLWNKTTIFNNVNTTYAGFGAAGPLSTQVAHISSFAMKDNKVWNGVDRIPQLITFPELADKKTNDADFSCGASSNANLPLVYASSNPAIATIGTDGSVHILASGTTTLTVTQPGNNVYEAAVAVSRVLTVNNSTLSPPMLWVQDDFETGTGNITGRTPEVATIAGRVYQKSISGILNANIIENGAAKLTYNIGEMIDITSTTGYTKPSSLTIESTFNLGTTSNNTPARPARSVYLGFWSSIPATGESFANMRGVFLNPEDGGLQLWNGTNNSQGTPVQTLAYQGTWDPSGSTVHSMSYTISTTTGNITGFKLDGVSYSWTSTNIFSDANTSFAGFGVASSTTGQYASIFSFKLSTMAQQEITFNPLPAKKIGDTDFDAGASSSSGLAVNYASSNQNVATIVNGQIHIVGAGTSTITASQPGNATYVAATSRTRVLTVSKLSQTISFAALPDKMVDDTDFNAGATASSGLAVSYSSSNTSVATIVNGQIHIVGSAGTTTITASQAGNSTYASAAALSQTLTVNKKTQSVSFAALPAKTVGDADFDAGASASSGLQVSYSSSDSTVASIINNNIHIIAAGTAVITASQPGSNLYQAAAASQTLTVNKKTQSVSFTSLSPKTIGDADFDGGASASSGLQISYTSSNEAVATIVNGNIHVFGEGSTVIMATQVGNSVFSPADAVSQTLTVVKKDQSITLSALPQKTIGDYDFAGQATASSGLSVTYSSSNTNVATIVEGYIHITGAGTALITASQTGDATYLPASDVTQTLTVVKKDQTIVFTSLPQKTVGDADFDAGALTSSALAVSYSSSNPYVATIVDGKIHIVGYGTCDIIASQAGNSEYDAAANVSRNLTVVKIDQSITFSAIPQKIVGDADFDPAATASSSLAVTYNSSNPEVAIIIDGKVHIVGAGTSTITASQEGNLEYSAINNVTQTLTVVKQDQSITFNALAQKTVGNADFDAAAVASSGLTITYSSSNSNVATIVNGQIHIVGTGTASITASQAGDNYYLAAPSVTQLLTIINTNQSMTFNPLAKMRLGDTDLTLTATASSGLTISYQSNNEGAVKIVNGKLHVVGVGSALITAAQAGDSNYAAVTKNQLLVVLPYNIKVLYQDGDTGQLSNNSIKPFLKIVNQDSVGVAYSELTARYWLTAENFAGLNTWIDYAQLGNNKVVMTYVPLAQPLNGAFGYIQYSFNPGSGSLATGSNSGVIQTRISNIDYALLNEGDDYSYLNSTSGYTLNDHITLYRNGVLIWGTEPGSVSPVTSLSISYQNQNTGTTGNTISNYLVVNNTGNQAVNYGDITVRYWFTEDGTQSLNYYLDYAKKGAGNMSGKFVTLSPGFMGADHYFELGVNPTVGTLYPLSNSGNIQYRIARSNWANFNEADDYSYKPKDVISENSRITAYYKGVLIYGTEPSGFQANLFTVFDHPKGQSEILTGPQLPGPILYPNPLQGNSFSIKLTSDLVNKPLTVKVINPYGVVVQSKTFGSVSGDTVSLVLPGSNLPGVYLVQLNDTQVLKLIVTR